jgi:predicted phage terminase large subunit-like protein
MKPGSFIKPLAERKNAPLGLEDVRAALARKRYDRERGMIDGSLAAVRTRCERSFLQFVREAWPVLEPRTRFVHSWHIDAICDHLEAVSAGIINRLLINVPPGAMKSLLCSVLWPAWEWGPKAMTSYRYISTSYAEGAVARDCRKMRMLITSDWYQRHWPSVDLIRAGELSFENSLTGTRDGVAFGSLTNKRGDRLIIDDPHSAEKAESSTDRERAVRRFREGAVNRLNDQQSSAIVIIMQRLNEADLSGEILASGGLGYTHLCCPMEYERSRHCETEIGFSDPRTKDGELLAPERFPQNVVDDLKRDMGVYAYAGQYQQRPAPRGGGIFPYSGWEFWHKSLAMKYGKSENQFPDFDFILGVVDTAFTEKQENDFSAMVVLGVWADLFGMSKIMLMHFWQKRLRFNDCVEEIIKSGRKLKCDRVLIENKAAGISVYQEIARLTREEEFALQLINPGAEDKEARANSVSHLFREEVDEGEARDGLIYVPCKTQENGAIWPREWAEDLMAQMAAFPKGKHDDGVDACVHGLRFLRARGLIRSARERALEETQTMLRAVSSVKQAPLYGGLGRDGLH